MPTLFTTVSSKGQIVIPSDLRDELCITTGTRIAIQRVDNRLVLEPITDDFVRSVRGCLKGPDSLVEVREREHRREK